MNKSKETQWVLRIDFRDGTASGLWAFDDMPSIDLNEESALIVFAGKGEDRDMQVIVPTDWVKIIAIRDMTGSKL